MVEATTGNARFFCRSGPYHLAVIAGVARGIASERDLLFEGVAPLQTAGPNEVSFLDNRRYASALDQTLAGAVIVGRDCRIGAHASLGHAVLGARVYVYVAPATRC